MEIKWLEDFLSVAETGSFTRSAQLRHLTQPALSRRVRALEHWVGTPLIDRSSYPTRLTPAGDTFRKQALHALDALYAARTAARGSASKDGRNVRFALPHSLSLSFFPQWLTVVQKAYGAFPSQLVVGNVHDAVMSFVEGNSDILICYQHATQPIDLDAPRFAFCNLGEETIRLYSRCDRDGVPQYDPAARHAALPFLNYTPDAYLRRIVDALLERSPTAIRFEPMHEAAMAEGLKNMVLEGHGVAFLPGSSVVNELRGGRLVAVGGEALSTSLEVRACVDRRRREKAIEQLWLYIEQNAALPV